MNSPKDGNEKKQGHKRREFRLKRLMRVTDENLRLVNDSRHDLYLTLALCLIAIIIGTVFIVLRGLDKDKRHVYKIVSNSISGIVGGGVLLQNIKAVFSSMLSKKEEGRQEIGFSEINVEIVEVSLTHTENDEKLNDAFLKSVEKTIEKRNDKLRITRIMCSIIIIFGALCLITLVLFDILLDIKSSSADNRIYGYIIDSALISGGVVGVVHCWARHIILSNPKKLVDWYAFIFFFHLLFIGFIPFGCYKTINEGKNKPESNNETSENEGGYIKLKIHCNMKSEKKEEKDEKKEEPYEKFLKHNDKIRGLCLRATILRVILVKDEREKVERLLSGLNLVDIETENSKEVVVDIDKKKTENSEVVDKEETID